MNVRIIHRTRFWCLKCLQLPLHVDASAMGVVSAWELETGNDQKVEAQMRGFQMLVGQVELNESHGTGDLLSTWLGVVVLIKPRVLHVRNGDFQSTSEPWNNPSSQKLFGGVFGGLTFL